MLSGTSLPVPEAWKNDARTGALPLGRIRCRNVPKAHVLEIVAAFVPNIGVGIGVGSTVLLVQAKMKANAMVQQSDVSKCCLNVYRGIRTSERTIAYAPSSC